MNDHLLDQCPFAATIWDIGAEIFHQYARVRGRPNLTIVEWMKNPFKNAILDRIWKLFPSFVLWEVWKERNQRIFRGKLKYPKGVWGLMVIHIQESLKLTSWFTQDMQDNALENRII